MLDWVAILSTTSYGFVEMSELKSACHFQLQLNYEGNELCFLIKISFFE